MRLFIERQGKQGARKITRNNRRFSMERPDKDGVYLHLCRQHAIMRAERRLSRSADLSCYLPGCSASGSHTGDRICPFTGMVLPCGGGQLEFYSDGLLLTLSYDSTGKLRSVHSR